MRRFVRIFSLLLTLVVCLLLVAFLWLQQQLRQLPIQQLDYQIAGWGLRQLQLAHLHFSYPLEQQSLRVELEQLSLQWHWQGFRPQLQQLGLHNAKLHLSAFPVGPESSTKPDSTSSKLLPERWHWPEWLPATTTIEQLQLDLPCAQSRCRYQGSVALQQTETLDAQLQFSSLQHPAHGLSLKLEYQVAQNWPQLSVMLDVSELLTMQFNSTLVEEQQTQTLFWQGATQLELLPPPGWVQAELALWQQQLPESWLQQFQQSIRAQSKWQLQVPARLDESFWPQLNGDIELQLSSPSPFYLPEFGLITAEVQAHAHFTDGQASPFRLAAGGRLSELQLPQGLTELGVQPQSWYWSLSSQQTEAFDLTALPLQLRLLSADQQQLLASLELNAPAQQLSIQQLQLQLALPELHYQDWSLLQLQLSTELTGQLSLSQQHWQTLEPLQLSVARLHNPELELTIETLELALSNGQVSWQSNESDTSSWQLQSQADLKLKQLQHPVLKPLSWQWQGKLQSASKASDLLQATGLLTASSGLELSTQLSSSTEQFSLAWQLADVFVLAGNPLASSLTDWPELLTLQRGRIRHQGKLDYGFNNDGIALSSETQLLDLSGFYDTTLFRNLTSQLELHLKDDTISIRSSDLTVKELEQGVRAGPLHLAASYQASLDAPTTGMVQLEHKTLGLFNGAVKLPAMTLDLREERWLLPLQLEQLDLQQLLTQHPTTDLMGHGLINGEIPLIISPQGFEVAQGRLQAKEPGGSLSYRSPQAQSMAASNPAMKTMFTALDDFHYTVLSSDVSYSTDGQLVLALRLEGRNPAMEGGRPVHLNITLEENIPALITSLQLTNQLNEVIQQRVQQRLQQPRRP